jgi:hypothetical protein
LYLLILGIVILSEQKPHKVEMNISKPAKKVWVRPAILSLNIKRDTFSGSSVGAELAGKAGPPAKV